MLRLHDVWVHWVDGNNQSYGIPEFFEWKKDDEISLLDSVPFLRVTSEFFTAVENSFDELPVELLSMVHLKAKSYDNKVKVAVEYAFVISDGKRILAVNTEGTSFPYLKSRTIPRTEQYALEMAVDEDVQAFSMVGEESEEELDFIAELLRIEPEDVIGLTRAEKAMKFILEDCLFSLSCSDNRAEIVYWYTELFPNTRDTVKVQTAGSEELLEEMVRSLKKGWSKRHEEFGNELVKVHDMFSGDWGELVKENKHLDAVK